MDAGDLMDLYTSDDPSMARARADAMSRNAQGLQGAGLVLRSLAGQRDPTGGLLSQIGQHEEDQLAQAAQHRAQMDVQRQHYANESAWRNAMLGVNQQKADQAGSLLALKAGEVKPMQDAWGNIVTPRKYQVSPGLLAGQGQAGGDAAQPGPSRRLLVNPNAPRQPAPAASSAQPAGGAAAVGPPPGSGMSQDAFDQAAEQYYRQGKAGHYGKAQGIMERAFRGRIAQLHPGEDLASTQGAFTADTASLKKQQQLLDLTQSWENTGKANLDILREVSGGLVNTGSPLANRPLRWLYQNAAGDPSVTKFHAAHSAVVNEYAKILSGNTGGGGVTEGARHEAEAMLPLDSTPEQIAAAADVLERDAGNRLSALKGQAAATQARMGHKTSPVAAPAGAAAPAAEIPTVQSPEEARKLAPGTRFKTPDGRVLVR